MGQHPQEFALYSGQDCLQQANVHLNEASRLLKRAEETCPPALLEEEQEILRETYAVFRRGVTRSMEQVNYLSKECQRAFFEINMIINVLRGASLSLYLQRKAQEREKRS